MNRIRIFIVFLVIVAIGYSFYHLVAASRDVPQEFSDARVRGALVAQNIVASSNTIVEDLKKVNQFDEEWKVTDALALTTDLTKRSEEIRAKAAELSKELEIMTASLSDMKSVEAKQAALAGISNHLALITRLINYSTYLEDLLSALRNKFNGVADSRKVSLLVSQINGEITAINNFNREAAEAMQRFDELTK